MCTNFFLSNHDDKSYRAKLGFEQFHKHLSSPKNITPIPKYKGIDH